MTIAFVKNKISNMRITLELAIGQASKNINIANIVEKKKRSKLHMNIVNQNISVIISEKSSK